MTNKSNNKNEVKKVKIINLIVFCIYLIILFWGFHKQNTKSSNEMSQKLLKMNAETIILTLDNSDKKCEITSEGIAKCIINEMDEDAKLDGNKITTADGAVWLFDCDNSNNCTLTIQSPKSEQIIIPFSYDPINEMYDLK